MRSHSAILALASSLLFAACGTSTLLMVVQADGFWSYSRELDLNAAHDLRMALPVPEEDFLSAVRSRGLRTFRLGERGSAEPVVPRPEFDRGLEFSRVSHAWAIHGGYHRAPRPHNEKYIAYVIDGQVVSVENAIGHYD